MSWRSLFSNAVVSMVTGTMIMAATPVMGHAVAGDPDNDGLPTMMDAAPLNGDADNDGLSDGAETFVTLTDPAVPDDVTTGQLDSMADSDTGGVFDGIEVANRSDVTLAGDDAFLTAPAVLGPLPAAPDFNPVMTDFTQPLTFSWEPGAYTEFFIRFAPSPRFETVVSEQFDNTQAGGATPSAATWQEVTRLGRMVYWRVTAVDSTTLRRQRSIVSSFVITGGVDNLAPPAAPAIDPLPRPTFSWAANGARGYRIFFTGSHQLGTKVMQVPKKGWRSGTTFRPTIKKWKGMTALGSTLTWWVVSRDAAGRWAYSMPSNVDLNGGASNLAVTGGPEPDDIRTFTADAGVSKRYKILFSNSEDFSKPDFVYPKKGFASYAGPISFTPGAAQWQRITATGEKVFWTVKGKVGKKHFTYSDISVLDLGGYLTVQGLATAGPNSVGSAYPTFTAEVITPVAGGVEPAAFNTSGYRLVFSDNVRMAGKKVYVPAAGFAADPAITLEQSMSAAIAKLNAQRVFLSAEGMTEAGNSYFSPPYLLAPAYQAAPTMADLGGTVRANTPYNVDWTPSAVASGNVLFWQIQQATNAAFTRGVRYFTVDLGTTVMEFRNRPSNNTTYYYRVRGVNSVGRGKFSNADSKLVRGQNWKPVYTTKKPMSDKGDDHLIDDKFFDSKRGTCEIKGPGWKDVCFDKHPESFCGIGFKGSYHHTSITRPADGTETAKWIPKLKKAGQYDVWVGWFATHNRDSHVEYWVIAADGKFGPFTVDQTDLNKTQTWVKLGRFYFNEGDQGFVLLDVTGTRGSEEADVAGFKYVGP